MRERVPGAIINSRGGNGWFEILGHGSDTRAFAAKLAALTNVLAAPSVPDVLIRRAITDVIKYAENGLDPSWPIVQLLTRMKLARRGRMIEESGRSTTPHTSDARSRAPKGRPNAFTEIHRTLCTQVQWLPGCRLPSGHSPG